MNCECEKYPFPHRPLGGSCNGSQVWDVVFEEGEKCEGCIYKVMVPDVFATGDSQEIRDCDAPSAFACPGIYSLPSMLKRQAS